MLGDNPRNFLKNIQLDELCNNCSDIVFDNKEFDIKHNFLYFMEVDKKLSSQIKENSTKDFFQDNIKNNIKENSDLYKEAREKYVNWAIKNNIDIWKG